MRLACPSCATAYDIPDRVLGPGTRTLRCARCGTEWTFAAPPAESAPNPPTAEAASSLPRYQEPAAPESPPAASSASADGSPALAISEPSIVRERPRRAWPPPAREAPSAEDPAPEPRHATPGSVWLSWVGTIVIIVLLVWGGYTFRTEVMQVWPASQRLYALMGIGPAAAPAPR